MYGFSIFMNDEMTLEKEEYIKDMKKTGAVGIFTSMHIPEDNACQYKSRLIDLGKVALEQGLQLVVDISGDALEKAGFSFEDLKAITNIGVTGLRMDYNISNETIAKASREMIIGLNASTITEQDVEELKKTKANFAHLEAWHNYYPRPETGLSRKTFLQKNLWLKKHDFKIVAFVPGDDNLRGPLFQTLPTLEEHRYESPLACALDIQKLGVDDFYIGDGGLCTKSKKQFSYFSNEKEILLEVEDFGSAFYSHCLGDHVNRLDEARDVIRSSSARFNEIPEVTPEPPINRDRGSVTIDNRLYGRYMGEIQITKVDLLADDKINVVGRVIEQDRSLLSFIQAGTKFKLEKEKYRNEFR
ncbi:MAG: MupG family TIM beta-alpha barrel fold protein [Lactobacillales bacterium]|jgi:hypothetical protein|nr:MupG family TIM beta-alpha barrel fold protein [Lactobacillales bacterium]